MAVVVSFKLQRPLKSQSENPNCFYHTPIQKKLLPHRHRRLVVYGCHNGNSASDLKNPPDKEKQVDNLGVKAALSILKFYKREISPIIGKSCRYVPTCSEYSMEAYKKYGFVKGTVLTTWRLCRCNPFGGSGFDPPRWFDETNLHLPEEEEEEE